MKIKTSDLILCLDYIVEANVEFIELSEEPSKLKLRIWSLEQDITDFYLWEAARNVTPEIRKTSKLYSSAVKSKTDAIPKGKGK